jgi:hypothetical protein
MAGGQTKASGGGITPDQQALANFNFGQNEIGNAGAFSNMPVSTGLTQADAGAQAARVKAMGQASNADAQAQANAINQQQAAVGQGIGGLGSALGGKGGGG